MVYYVEAAGQVMMHGPTGIMVPLGIENYFDLTTSLMFYNYIALGIIFFIAAMSGSRSESRFCILIPVFSGLMTWIGWLNSPDPAQTWAVTIIAGILGIMIYMNDMNHEKYGIAGPGSKLLNVAIYLILFQAAIGLIAGFGIFPGGSIVPKTDICNVGFECNQYRNIDLEASVAQINDSSGVLDDIISTVAQLPIVVWQALVFLVKIAGSVLLFSVTLTGLMDGLVPGIADNTLYLIFVAFMQIAIWAIYMLAVVNWPSGSAERTI